MLVFPSAGVTPPRISLFYLSTLSVCRQAARVASQLKLVIRPMYSNPPVYGARLVTEILSDEALTEEWTAECKVRMYGGTLLLVLPLLG